ncbi:MAG: adenylate/guanylate cyclase domain-containing protein [Proteobacteria bacterium]|nr:adenylate/guanylate cyclase domain-containing protein [Pseudomonadota bacterium]
MQLDSGRISLGLPLRAVAPHDQSLEELMKPSVTYKYHSLDDYLLSKRLDVDGMLDDGWGAHFPVKAREIDAAVLFADICSFSARTKDLSPIETLIFLNNFLAWISAEALRDGTLIVDKYIGDEIMLVFSKEFGSLDPFVDALRVGRAMLDRDALGFAPRIGIAMGRVAVGYVGTPLRYNCTVLGAPVVVAKRCCGIGEEPFSSITFPAELWAQHQLEEVFPRRKRQARDGTIFEEPLNWQLGDSRVTALKNIGERQVRTLFTNLVHFSQYAPEDRARDGLTHLKREGSYHYARYSYEAE